VRRRGSPARDAGERWCRSAATGDRSSRSRRIRPPDLGVSPGLGLLRLVRQARLLENFAAAAGGPGVLRCQVRTENA